MIRMAASLASEVDAYANLIFPLGEVFPVIVNAQEVVEIKVSCALTDGVKVKRRWRPAANYRV